MSNFGYKIRNKQGIHFITFSVIEWVDVFTRIDYQQIIIDSLKFCQKEKGLIIYAWCLMSNHIHLIITAKDSNLSEILRDFKKFTSVQIIKTINSHPKESRKKWMLSIFRKAGIKNIKNKNYQFWKQENHPKELFSEKFTREKLEYVHNNPVKSGIVQNPTDGKAKLIIEIKDSFIEIKEINTGKKKAKSVRDFLNRMGINCF